MGWSASKIFVTFIEDCLENTAAYDLNAPDTFKAALFNDTITPDNTVATAARAFGGGVWAGGEVFDGAEWATGGVALDTPTSTTAAAVYKFDAIDTVSTGTSATLAAVFGCLVHDSTVGNSGLCYNYFGGTNSVTDGTFTIVWAGTGIFTLTLT